MTPAPRPDLSLAEGMDRSSISFHDLWLGVLALGSELTALEVEAYVIGVLQPGGHEHNVIAQALNEESMAQGGDHPVAYRHT